MTVPGAEKDGQKSCLLPGHQEKAPWMKKMIVAIMAISNLFAWICVSLLASFYPTEALAKDVSETVIGFIYSCSELTIFLFAPVVGKCLSRFNPKYIYISGICVFGSCEVAFGFVNNLPNGSVFIAVSFLLRILQAVGTAGILTSAFAITASQFPERTATIFGLLETVTALGFMLGPTLGAALYQANGFGLPFWVFGGAVFMCGCVACFLLPYNVCVSVPSGPSRLALFRSPLVWYGSHCIMASTLAFSSWVPILAIHLQQFKLSPSLIGLIFIIPALFYSPSAPLWGALLDKQIPPLPLTTVGLVLASLVMLFYGPAPFFTFIKPSLWLIVVTAPLHGLSMAPPIVGGMRCIMQAARNLGFPDSQSTFALIGGIVQSSISLGTFIGTSLGGILGDHFGFQWTMVASSISLLLPVLWFCPIWALQKRQGRKQFSG